MKNANKTTEVNNEVTSNKLVFTKLALSTYGDIIKDIENVTDKDIAEFNNMVELQETKSTRDGKNWKGIKADIISAIDNGTCFRYELPEYVTDRKGNKNEITALKISNMKGRLIAKMAELNLYIAVDTKPLRHAVAWCERCKGLTPVMLKVTDYEVVEPAEPVKLSETV